MIDRHFKRGYGYGFFTAIAVVSAMMILTVLLSGCAAPTADPDDHTIHTPSHAPYYPWPVNP